MQKKILVVDDERPIAEILKYNLEGEGFQVDLAFDGEMALEKAFQGNEPDLIILDIMMPKKDGWSVCREIREKTDIPIIMFTARDEEADKILGLGLGADDYVTKPFSAKELIARVKAVLRRVELSARKNESASVIVYDSLRLDQKRVEVTKNGVPVNLTHREFALLQFFLENPGQVFTRENLLDKVWGYDYIGEERTVDVTIRRLREKIEDDPANPYYICTRRGLGYYLRRL